MITSALFKTQFGKHSPYVEISPSDAASGRQRLSIRESRYILTIYIEVLSRGGYQKITSPVGNIDDTSEPAFGTVPFVRKLIISPFLCVRVCVCEITLFSSSLPSNERP